MSCDELGQVGILFHLFRSGTKGNRRSINKITCHRSKIRLGNITESLRKPSTQQLEMMATGPSFTKAIVVTLIVLTTIAPALVVDHQQISAEAAQKWGFNVHLPFDVARLFMGLTQSVGVLWDSHLWSSAAPDVLDRGRRELRYSHCRRTI